MPTTRPRARCFFCKARLVIDYFSLFFLSRYSRKIFYCCYDCKGKAKEDFREWSPLKRLNGHPPRGLNGHLQEVSKKKISALDTKTTKSD